MPKRKLKLVEKIILLSTVFMAIFLIGFWLSLKRTNRRYIIPQGYKGWVTIRYNFPGSPPLPEVDGFYQLQIPDSGYLFTSTPLEKGWGKDEFYWQSPSGLVSIPNYTQTEEGTQMYIHGRDIRPFSHEALLNQLPVGVDTLLWDGTELNRKSATEVRYKPGKVSLEYFYLFPSPQPIDVPLPKIPNKEALESMKDRIISNP